MAEGFLRSVAGDRFVATSGAVDSEDAIHPIAAEVMAEAGIDITTQRPKHVRQWFKEDFGYVITLDDTARERSPVFPFTPHLLHWSLPDPTVVEGSRDERKNAFRQVRDEIKTRVLRFVEQTEQNVAA
jgi:arsenate reductase (thioredoxin)